MPNLNFDVRMTNSANTVGENRSVGVRIEDRLSGEVIVDIEFTPDQFVALLSNAGVKQSGFTTGHPERVGKVLRVESFEITREMLGDAKYGDDSEAVAQSLAEEHLSVLNDTTPGHRLRYVSRNNAGGFKAVFDRWENPTEDDLEKAAGRRY